MIGDFHFLRPAWLLLLPVAAALGWIVSHRQDMRTKWQHAIAPHLLDHLLVERRVGARIRPVHLTILLLVLGAIAAAGPTWQHERSPFVADIAPLAIAIDLSQTMDSTDIAPSRLERAKLKVKDLLEVRQGARTALFVYAGSAHMVLPLTDDKKLIGTYVDALKTGIMPVSGKNTTKALATIEAGLARETVPGTILFMTDGVEPEAFEAFARHAGRNELMILGIGRAGETSNGGANFDVEALQRLRSGAGIRLASITADDQDVQWIARRAASHLLQAQTDAGTRWQDIGWWLMIPITLLGALWFRQGWTIRWSAAALLAALMLQSTAQAAERSFTDLWLSPDQQGRLAYDRGDFGKAADTFVDPMWKGVALYRLGQFDRAAEAFARVDSAEARFDQGNALARLGKLSQAVAAYEEAIRERPDWQEAKDNLKVVQDAIAAKPKNDEQDSNELDDRPDQFKFDDKGEKGKKSVVDVGRQTAEVWMRNIQVSPTDLLARRFSIEAQEKSE
ncbi:Ca-activated chloride channel family protein [Tardiphaga sp. OK246]|uniref:vWA domain-containing protein n=1 Tax=Tardiphaga sp. OK246 TaxID=1855307 RepID=UPI000B6E34AD|nr:VWA domain-containing protein [Tardiphaga sp. OK246]SNT12029.1 Ca-activated chloride channel family protein [Tardiphaga sp. OK246]